MAHNRSNLQKTNPVMAMFHKVSSDDDSFKKMKQDIDEAGDRKRSSRITIMEEKKKEEEDKRTREEDEARRKTEQKRIARENRRAEKHKLAEEEMRWVPYQGDFRC